MLICDPGLLLTLLKDIAVYYSSIDQIFWIPHIQTWDEPALFGFVAQVTIFNFDN
jgi:hypothetical protein